MNQNNNVTLEQVNRVFEAGNIQVETFGQKTTVVVLTLANGFVLVESSSCVDPENYSLEVGKSICMGRLKDRVWELEGYLLQDRIYHANDRPQDKWVRMDALNRGSLLKSDEVKIFADKGKDDPEKRLGETETGRLILEGAIKNGGSAEKSNFHKPSEEGKWPEKDAATRIRALKKDLEDAQKFGSICHETMLTQEKTIATLQRTLEKVNAKCEHFKKMVIDSEGQARNRNDRLSHLQRENDYLRERIGELDKKITGAVDEMERIILANPLLRGTEKEEKIGTGR